jgi:hypothetical protein
MMKTAVSERLHDLEALCRRIAALLDAEDPHRLLPGMALARLAVDADLSANRLAAHLDTLLAAVGAQAKGEGPMSTDRVAVARLGYLEAKLRDLADTVQECCYRVALIERELVALLDRLARLAEARAQAPQPAPIPAELREAFADVGRRLPDVWPRLSAEGKKSLLRTLVEGVNLARESNGMVQVRIVWRGGLAIAAVARWVYKYSSGRSRS